MCHMSHVMCHMSQVTCHHLIYFFFFFGQRGEVSQWRVCYQPGLPCLVSTEDIRQSYLHWRHTAGTQYKNSIFTLQVHLKTVHKQSYVDCRYNSTTNKRIYCALKVHCRCISTYYIGPSSAHYRYTAGTYLHILKFSFVCTEWKLQLHQ